MIGYVGEIEAPWLIEVIAERFDYSAINAMTEDSLIYGGAIRDALAGIPLEGDLDIVLPPHSLLEITRLLDSSSKWTRVSGGPKIESCGIVEIVRETSTNYPQSLNIQSIVTYRNVNDATLQIVMPNNKASFGNSSMDSSYELISSVDIVCCGLAMDREGKIFEILEGAHHDCQNRILRFNERVIASISIDKLSERIKKLEDRGWKSEIDLADVKKRSKEVKPKEKEEFKSIDIGYNGGYKSPNLEASRKVYDIDMSSFKVKYGGPVKPSLRWSANRASDTVEESEQTEPRPEPVGLHNEPDLDYETAEQRMQNLEAFHKKNLKRKAENFFIQADEARYIHTRDRYSAKTVDSLRGLSPMPLAITLDRGWTDDDLVKDLERDSKSWRKWQGLRTVLLNELRSIDIGRRSYSMGDVGLLNMTVTRIGRAMDAVNMSKINSRQMQKMEAEGIETGRITSKTFKTFKAHPRKARKKLDELWEEMGRD